MINWKSLYLVLGVFLGAAGAVVSSPELLMLALAFIASAALQIWLAYRSSSAQRRLSRRDGMLAIEP